MMDRLYRHAAIAIMICAGSGCSTGNVFSRLTVSPSPHETYATSLRNAGLDSTAVGADWLRAGQDALSKPVTVALPFRETGYVPPERPTAVVYQMDLKRGRLLVVEVTFDAVDAARLFVDLFESRGNELPERVASLQDGTTLTHEIPRDGVYLLRVQPELLRGGRYTIVERTQASLRFPVQGLTAAAVQSEFGAARDAGRREHEGIDIFAPRNTAVVAAVAGTAAADTNRLGGNVVWLRGGGRSYYYAHLQRAAFEGTSSVQAGDVVGYVGNSGNARTTPTHLHFGIYERGAIDPLPFIHADDPTPPPTQAPLTHLGELVRIAPARTALRSGPGRTAPVRAQLSRATVARVLGASLSSLRVALPGGETGYLDSGSVARTDVALRRQSLPSGASIHEQPATGAPVVAILAESATVDVLGESGGFHLVRLGTGPSGWISLPDP